MHMAEIMYGKPVADRIEQGVRAEIEELSRDHNVIPRLDVVVVGKNAPSLRYVGKKMESCRRMGMYAELHNLDNEVSAQALRDYVKNHGDRPDAAKAKRWLDRLDADGKVAKN